MQCHHDLLDFNMTTPSSLLPESLLSPNLPGFYFSLSLSLSIFLLLSCLFIFRLFALGDSRAFVSFYVSFCFSALSCIHCSRPVLAASVHLTVIQPQCGGVWPLSAILGPSQ